MRAGKFGILLVWIYMTPGADLYSKLMDGAQ